MERYTKEDLNNQAMREEFRNRNTHIVNGYSLFMYRIKYSENGKTYNRVSILNDTDKVDIYPHDSDLNGGNTELRIQTTSWGALNFESMQKKMALYQTALDTVEWYNNFDWEKADIYEDYE